MISAITYLVYIHVLSYIFLWHLGQYTCIHVTTYYIHPENWHGTLKKWSCPIVISFSRGPFIFTFPIFFWGGGFPIDTFKKIKQIPSKIFSWKVILEYHAIENICRSPMILGVNTFTGSSYLPVKSRSDPKFQGLEISELTLLSCT